MSDNPRDPKDFETTTGFPLSTIASVRLAIADYCIGLDLNHWRPNLDLKAAKQQGIRFIITKATQGDYLFDEWYEPYRDQSKTKSLPFGAFHYWDANIDPLKQAKYFFDHVGDDIQLLPIWDIEKYGNQGVLPPATAAQQIHDGLQETEQLFGREVMIYTNRDSWQVLTANSPIIAAFPLWVASWTTLANPVLPIGASEWVYWQYTNRFSIPDAPHAGYDADRYNGNEGKFEEYVRSLNGQPSPIHEHPEILVEIENLNSLADQHDNQLKALVEIDAITDGYLIDHDERLKILEQKMTDIGKVAGG